MVKRQTTLRMSDSTRTKLDWLTERHGTATEVIALALDRMYREENKTMDTVFYGFHAADLFTGDEEAECDERASAKKYADLVKAKLTKLFPSAEVTVDYDLDASGVLPYPLQTRYNGERDAPEIADIDQAASIVFQYEDWVVPID